MATRFIRVHGRIVPIKDETHYKRAAAIGAVAGAAQGTATALSTIAKHTKMPSLQKSLPRLAQKFGAAGIVAGVAATAYAVKQGLDARKGNKLKSGVKHYGATLGGNLIGQTMGAVAAGAGVAVKEIVRRSKFKVIRGVMK